MNHAPVLLNVSLALLVLGICASLLDTRFAVFGWIGVGLSAVALMLAGGALVKAPRRR